MPVIEFLLFAVVFGAVAYFMVKKFREDPPKL